MQWLKNFKTLKASSLVESVIAIAIISICVLVAFTVYLNVVRQDKSIHFYNARHKVEHLTIESIEKKDYEDNVFKYDGYTITKEAIMDEETKTILLSFLLKMRYREYQIKKIIPFDE